MSDSAARLAFRLLEHDLHYRASSFVPDLSVRRPGSLARALRPGGQDEDSVVRRWEALTFDEIITEVKQGVSGELERQRGRSPNFESWRAAFLQSFERVEYIVNVRLLHALRRVPDELLGRLVARVLGTSLDGDPLEVGWPEHAERAGRRWYHVAQSDGMLLGPRNLVSLELKTCGKTRGTKLDAGQVAKHLWLLDSVASPGGTDWSSHLLVLLPQVNGKLRGLATDLQVEGSRLRIRRPGNKPLRNFLGGLGESERRAVESRLGDARIAVASFDALAGAADELGVEGAAVYDLQTAARHARAETESA